MSPKKRLPGVATALVEIRAQFLAFAVWLVFIGIIATILGDVTPRTHSDMFAVALVVVFACVGLCIFFVGPRQLDCHSLETLRASYRARFFLRVAASSSAALAGFVIGIKVGPWWVYFVGLAFASFGMYLDAPTQTHLRGDQERLTAAGCQLWLMDALCVRVP